MSGNVTLRILYIMNYKVVNPAFISLCLVQGTTEKIFEHKLEVYDVYVDNQNIKCKPHLSWIARFNNADRDRLDELESFR